MQEIGSPISMDPFHCAGNFPKDQAFISRRLVWYAFLRCIACSEHTENCLFLGIRV